MRQGASTPSLASSSIVELEQALLGYFGSSPAYSTLSSASSSATAALQACSSTQSQAVPWSLLFPHLSSMPETDDCDIAAAAPSYTRSPNMEDLRLFRALANRFNSTVDSQKTFGDTEAPLRTIQKDICEIWHEAGLAWQELLAQHSMEKRSCPALPRRVVFVVCYAHTQQTYGIGGAMTDIVAQVRAKWKCRLGFPDASSILRIVPIFIGMQPLLTSRRGDGALGSGAAGLQWMDGNPDSRIGMPPDGLTYPSAGLYTCAAVAQCLSRLAPHEAGPSFSTSSSVSLPNSFGVATKGHREVSQEMEESATATKEAGEDVEAQEIIESILRETREKQGVSSSPPQSVPSLPLSSLASVSPSSALKLDKRIIFLSDSWLHVRGIADLLRRPGAADRAAANSGEDECTPRSNRDAAAIAASDDHSVSHRPFYFVPEYEDKQVYVFPAVITDRLSAKELDAFSQYLWCRAVSD